MPLHRVGGVNGSVTMVTGHNADWAGFSVDAEQDIDNDTAYADTAVSKIGNGLPELIVTANGFLKAGVASSSPGHAAMTAVGGTCTFLYDTGCSISGTGIVRRISSGNGRRTPASPVQIRVEMDGAITETWAVT
jgi:hypothetical protein